MCPNAECKTKTRFLIFASRKTRANSHNILRTVTSSQENPKTPRRVEIFSIHAYTILCPAPSTLLRDALPPPPRAGEEGSVVPSMRLSLVYGDASSGDSAEASSDDGAQSIAWMQPITFRDMRMPRPSRSPGPPAQVDLAMCLSGVFGIGGGRFLPEYIEYHRALGVGLFEVLYAPGWRVHQPAGSVCTPCRLTRHAAYSSHYATNARH